jgi:hypothetical protein
VQTQSNFIMQKVARHMANLSNDFLVDFFVQYPIMAERCRVAIDVAREKDDEKEIHQAPFPEAQEP